MYISAKDDYAGANPVMDSYGDKRENLVTLGIRSASLQISINGHHSIYGNRS
jgi:hypothetical protein